MYSLAIDCGGTKTAFLLADETGRIVAQTVTGGGGMHNPEAFGPMMRQAFEAMQQQCGARAEEVGYVAGGILGFTESLAWEDHCHKELQAIYPNAQLFLRNDVLIAIYGSLGMESGIHVISGTGSIAFGCDLASGKEARTGGWAAFSDEGSGSWLGMRTLEHFYRELDGRLPRGPLYDIFVKHFDLQGHIEGDMLEKYRQRLAGKRHEIARLQLLLLEAYRQGDPAAVDLYDQAAYYLADCVRGVYNRLQMSGTVKVSYSGGLFKTGNVILLPFKRYLKDLNLVVCDPLLEPVYGALLKALLMSGMDRDTALATLQAQANQ